MNLNKLVNLIFDSASSLNINKGKELCSKELISNIKSRKVNNMYHIYGEAKHENKALTYNTHLAINLQNSKLEYTKCTCESHNESSQYKKDYLCEHLVGTTEQFYNLAKKKARATTKTKNNGDIILESYKNYMHSREELSIEVKINYNKTSSLEYYDIEFRIGNKIKYLIRDLDAFINSYNNREVLRFSNEFVYKPKIHYFSTTDEKIIEFIDEYVKIAKNSISNNNNLASFSILSGRNLRILPSGIKRFMELLSNKNINFKYDHISCDTEVIYRDLPLSLTLKERDNMFILSAPKNIPIDITKNGGVYFYDRKLYIPSKKQDKAYYYIYEELKNSGALFFNKTSDNYLLLARLLNDITNNVNYDEGIKHFSSNLVKPKFYFSLDRTNVHNNNLATGNNSNDELYIDILNIKLIVKLHYGEQIVDLIKGIDEKSFVIRDNIKEQKIEMLLETLKFIKKNGVYIFIGDDYDKFNLIKNGFNTLRDIGEVYLSDEIKSIKLFDRSSVELYIEKANNNMLDLSYKFGDIDYDEYAQLFQAYNENKPFYRTKRNSFLDLEDIEIREFINLIDVLSDSANYMSSSIKVHENKSVYLENKINNSNLNISSGAEIIKNLSSKLTEVENVNYEIPKQLNANLRDYQLTGYNWLKTLAKLGFGGILADEMGLGKTIQTIAFILSEQPKKTIIVVPTSLVYNWKDEFIKFAPSIDVGIVHGDKTERSNVLEDLDNYTTILTTYGTLRRDLEYYKNVKFDYIIIDEGQNIKNHEAKNTEAVKSLSSKCKFALTGTPLENNLMELWSIFDFTMPGYLYSKEKFKDRFVSRGGGDLDELRKLIDPFILRREKKDVLQELPDKVNKKFLVEMTKGQKLVYKSYIKQVKDIMRKEKENKFEVFSYLTKLRQICLDPSLVIDSYTGGSGKFDIALNLVATSIESGNKILLFSQFTSVLKIFSKELENSNINYLYLDGSTPSKKRVELVDEFNTSKDIRVFLISLKAGGTGLNLTSANVVIHFDPWWNPAIEDQATDRAHRIGQKNMVEVIKLVAKETIEEKIILLQEEKKELINNLIHGDAKDTALINTLSYDELISLFAD